jgi:uncharacterized repeat protein (TIGR03803 family)
MKTNKGFGKLSWRTSAYAVLALCATTALPAQTFTVLHIFDMTDGEAANGLVQGTDGILYGTTFAGGPSYLNLGLGTVFTITPSGTLTTLYSFCPQSGCADGEYPLAGLIQAPNGNFYGTTSGGGASKSGTVFTITPSGTLTTLHNFDGTDGSDSQAALVLGTNGKFYGTWIMHQELRRG